MDETDVTGYAILRVMLWTPPNDDEDLCLTVDERWQGEWMRLASWRAGDAPSPRERTVAAVIEVVEAFLVSRAGSVIALQQRRLPSQA
jgi:hypothetical protein